ncbi:excinuclease ABC subunit C [bacterium (Candidatus Torokbacteria) CG_4_10_14_0_2_um_filter_35_8]|nr:MAG: excinuclease ABC subunit C [bacterium (Candidatus Torokbacteria) CG_4_10_14_0_2_um_filter_35_8]
MHNYYVYILRSIKFPDQIYIGYTTNPRKRLKKHNAGESKHARKFRSWKIEICIAFSSKELALKFEKYLKTGSGKAFMKKRLIE